MTIVHLPKGKKEIIFSPGTPKEERMEYTSIKNNGDGTMTVKLRKRKIRINPSR